MDLLSYFISMGGIHLTNAYKEPVGDLGDGKVSKPNQWFSIELLPFLFCEHWDYYQKVPNAFSIAKVRGN